MNPTTQFYKDAIGWGLLLWLFGYLLGIILFFLVPPSLIGWVITPIATVVTLWVLRSKIKSNSFSYYFGIAVVWVIIAVVFDYLFIVKAFNPADGYYKTDVYVYYLLTFLLPLIVGKKRSRSIEK
jgi:hypothetical protein